MSAPNADREVFECPDTSHSNPVATHVDEQPGPILDICDNPIAADMMLSIEPSSEVVHEAPNWGEVEQDNGVFEPCFNSITHFGYYTDLILHKA